jgi:hypothetical protein
VNYRNRPEDIDLIARVVRELAAEAVTPRR